MKQVLFVLLFSGSFISCTQNKTSGKIADTVFDTEYKSATFNDAGRMEKIMQAFPAIDKIFKAYADSNHLPGVAYGLVVDGNKFDGYIDGKLIKSVGLSGIGITPNTEETKYGIEFGKTNTMKDTLMVAEHKRLTYPMDPKGVWDLYMKGNGANGLTQAASDMNINLSSKLTINVTLS